MINFILWLVFFASAFGIGRLISGRNSQYNCGIDLALGSALYAFIFGLLTCWRSPPHHIFLIVGIALASIGIAGCLPTPRLFFPKSGFARLFFTACLTHVTLKLVEGFQIPTHGDAYVAYLRGPRLAWSSGEWETLKSAPILFLATSWEALCSWGIVLWPSLQSIETLANTQRFSQWTNGGISNLGLALTSVALIQAIFEGSKTVSRKSVESLAWVSAFSILCIPSLRWTANLAKHDLGVGFWVLAAFVLLYQNPLPRTVFLAGWLMGLGCIGKLSIIPAVSVMLILWLLSKPKVRNWKMCSLLALGGFLGLLPWVLRNGIATGNPIYPFASSLFQSFYGGISQKSGSDRALSFSPPNIRDQWQYLLAYFQQWPLSYLGLPLGTYYAVKKQIDFTWIAFSILGSLAFGLLLQ
ncbi:MAG: hypothetical protein KGQ59_10090, partial [Bdellovibrionales bacterium]|nr:hypothetical protein [Bdellovibrionales bacterium]